MGFLERLRRDNEANPYAAPPLRTQQDAAEDTRRQAEEMKKQLREERHLQALKFREESGIHKLLRTLCQGFHPHGDVHETYIRSNLIWQKPVNIDMGGEIMFPMVVYPTSDNLFDKISWPTQHNKVSRPEYSQRYFMIETGWGGEIVFHYNAKPIMVAETKWRVNKDILEDCLEKAYYNPKVERWDPPPNRAFGASG